MKSTVFRILFVGAVIIVIFAWLPSVVEVIREKNDEKELREKLEIKDSLEQVVARIKNNAEEKRKEARRMGYSKNEETMLKIVSPNIKKENDKTITNIILLISACVIFILVTIFAVLAKKKGSYDSKQ